MKKVNPKPSLLKQKIKKQCPLEGYFLFFEEDFKNYSFPKDNNQFVSVHYAISRESVEACNISQIVRMLNETNERKNIGISVSGYGDDSRELQDIEEVRNYFQKLFLEVPNIFNRLNAFSVQLLALCLYGEKFENGYRVNVQNLRENVELQVLQKFYLTTLITEQEMFQITDEKVELLLKNASLVAKDTSELEIIFKKMVKDEIEKIKKNTK